jgi:hypothetical protein
LNLLTYGSSHIQAERRKQTGIASENKIFWGNYKGSAELCIINLQLGGRIFLIELVFWFCF